MTPEDLVRGLAFALMISQYRLFKSEQQEQTTYACYKALQSAYRRKCSTDDGKIHKATGELGTELSRPPWVHEDFAD